MEANMIKSSVKQRKTVYDGRCEIGVESDIVLPDYYADIERIIHCTLTARVSSKRVEGQRLSVGGMAFLRLNYLDSDGRMQSFESQIPFSKSVELQQTGENCIVSVRVDTEYSNCQAVSRRRFEVRGALAMKAKVCCLADTEIVTGIDGDLIETKTKTVDAVIPVSGGSESFTVMEEYELAGAPISSVVRMTASSSVEDVNIVSGKVIIKGNVKLNIAYIAEDSESTQNVSYTVPINQVISAPDAEEGDDAQVQLYISRMSAEPLRHSDKSELAIEVQMEANVGVNRNSTLEMVTDAYSIQYETECSPCDFQYTVFEKTLSRQQSVNVRANNGEIIDAFATVRGSSAAVNEQGEVVASVDLAVCMPIKLADGGIETENADRTLEISLGASPDFTGAVIDGYAEVISVETASGKNQANITVNAVFTVTKTENTPIIGSMDLLTDCPKNTDSKTALTVYYAFAGEDAFDIAKRYNTSAAAVKEENELDGDIIKNDRMLLIPMIK